MLDFTRAEFSKAISLNPATSLDLSLRGREANAAIQNPFADFKFEMVRLGEVCKLQQGYAFKSSDYVDKSNTFLIRIGNIRENGTFEYDYKSICLPDDYALKYEKWVLKNNDIIVVMTDGTARKVLGKTALVKTINDKKFLLNQRVGRIQNINKSIDFKFLYLIVNSNQENGYFKNVGSGSIQINISTDNFLSQKIPLPPLEIQKQIVSECESIESKSQLIKDLIALYRDLISAVLAKCGISESSHATAESILSQITTLQSKLDFSSLRGREATEAIHESKIDCHDLALSNLAMTELLKSLPTPPQQGWEKAKLGDLGRICMCKRVMKHETNSISGIPFYKIGTFGAKARCLYFARII